MAGVGAGRQEQKIIPKVCALVAGTVKPKDVTTATNCNRDSRKHCLFFHFCFFAKMIHYRDFTKTHMKNHGYGELFARTEDS